MYKTVYIYTRMYYYMLKYRKLVTDVETATKYATEIAKRTIHYAGYDVQVVGLENIPDLQGVMYVSNHQSFFDIFASIAILDRQLAFVAKKQLENFFSVGFYVKALGGILIDRDDVKSQVRSIRDLTTSLQNGQNVMLFPEGTRSRDGVLGEFKSGAFKMALKSKCLIVPITFYDNYDVVQNQGNKTLKVKIDRAISFDKYGDLKTVGISDKVKMLIQDNLDRGFEYDKAQDYTPNINQFN